MRPQTTSVTGVGSSPWLSFDYAASGTVALQINVTGTITWTLESTLDFLEGPAPVTPVVIASADTNMVAQTVSRQSNYIAAPRACRVTTSAGSGTATITAIQYSARI